MLNAQDVGSSDRKGIEEDEESKDVGNAQEKRLITERSVSGLLSSKECVLSYLSLYNKKKQIQIMMKVQILINSLHDF